MGIDILLIAILAIVTWCVASEGAWGAAIMALSVLFSGLLAMNFFEPLANVLEQNVSSSPSWSGWCDVIALVGLFILFVYLLRALSERLLPEFLPVHPLLHEAGRWSAAAMTGYITMAFLLVALHTSPLPREFFGFKPERANLFGMVAPDRQWLGFTQYVSAKSMKCGGNTERVFDGPMFSAGEYTNQRWPSFPIRYATRRESGPMRTASGGGTRSATRSVRGARSGRSVRDSEDDSAEGRLDF